MGMMDIMYPGRGTELGEVDDILRPNADSNPLLARGVVTTSLDALMNWARSTRRVVRRPRLRHSK